MEHSTRCFNCRSDLHLTCISVILCPWPLILPLFNRLFLSSNDHCQRPFCVSASSYQTINTKPFLMWNTPIFIFLVCLISISLSFCLWCKGIAPIAQWHWTHCRNTATQIHVWAASAAILHWAPQAIIGEGNWWRVVLDKHLGVWGCTCIICLHAGKHYLTLNFNSRENEHGDQSHHKLFHPAYAEIIQDALDRVDDNVKHNPASHGSCRIRDWMASRLVRSAELCFRHLSQIFKSKAQRTWHQFGTLGSHWEGSNCPEMVGKTLALCISNVSCIPDTIHERCHCSQWTKRVDTSSHELS